MERGPIVLPTTGGVDKDTSPRFVRKGDQILLNNFEWNEKQVGVQSSAQQNVLAVDFGSVSLQQQKTRIYLTTFPDTMNVTLKDVNDFTRFSASTAATQTLAGAKQAIIDLLQISAYQITFESTGSEPYLDVTINYFYQDYIIEVTDNTTDILLEAISQTGVGTYMPIGSYDLLGDFFVWLTTQREERTAIGTPIDIYPSVNNQIGVTKFSHGLANNESIAISGINGVPQANGIYTIQVIDADNFILLGSSFSGAFISATQQIYKNIFGYGCIGVVQYTRTSNTYLFTPLLRSKQLNFNTKNEFYQPQVVKNGERVSMYYTDNYNTPRKTYYDGVYLEDGAISSLYPTSGIYSYTTLNIETALQVNTGNYTIELLEQVQSGGNIPSSGCRYGVVFVAEGGAQSEMTLLSDYIPVYEPAYVQVTPFGPVSFNIVYGTLGATNKINRILVSGFNPGVFVAIQLYYFQYASSTTNVSTSAFFIREEPLGDRQNEIILEHNGGEPETAPYDATLAQQVQISFRTAKDLTLINNRLLVANYTTTQDYDLRDWVANWKYSITKESIEAQLYPATTEGEFFDPNNTKKAGYSLQEWVRFYAVFKSKLTGRLTSAYFLYDVRFNSQKDYDPNEFITTNLTDRRDLVGDELIDYSLGDLGEIPTLEIPNSYFQFGIRVKNIDWFFQIEGVPARDLFSDVLIYRAEIIPEVQANGIFRASAIPFTYPDNFAFLTDFYRFDNIKYSAIGSELIEGTDFKFRTVGSFYAPDIQSSPLLYENIVGDQIILYGSMFNFSITVGDFLNNEYDIFQKRPINATSEALFLDIDKYFYKQSGDSVGFDGVIFSKTIGSPLPTTTDGLLASGPIIKTSDWDYLESQFPNDDDGTYQASLFRRIKDKYGDAEDLNKTVWCQSKISYPDTEGRVFGGDVFTQNVYFKNATSGQVSQFGQIGGFITSGFGFSLISQNRFNQNLRIWDSTSTTLLYPVSTQDPAAWLVPQQFDTYQVSGAYSINNNVQRQVVYNSRRFYSGKFSKRKVWSQLTPNGSQSDNYPIFLPLDFQDNPDAFGDITGVVELNNELYTIQERGFTREYFNTRGRLQASDVGEILVGDGSVLSRVGDTLTAYGTKNRGSFVKGFSSSGKPILMYINTEYKGVVRFGADGITDISLRGNWKNFFDKNLDWVENANTPADGYGITGVWDQVKKNFIFSVKGWKKSPPWDGLVFWELGDVVELGFTFSGVPQLYVSLINNNNQSPIDNRDAWEKISIENNQYYNVYTFTYNETKDRFTQNYGFAANFMGRWVNKFFTGYPNLETNNRGQLYFHAIDGPISFYGEAQDCKITVVVNDMPNENKKLMAMQLDCNVKPKRVDITSLYRNDDLEDIELKTFMLEENFETRDGYQIGSIPLNLDGNGSPDGDTNQMEGIYSIFEFTFSGEKPVTLKDIIIFIRGSRRNFKK
jgi:hypothetical protein